LLGANPANPRGLWEPRKAVQINNAILHRRGSGWHDPSLRLQTEWVFDADEEAACIAEIGAFLTTLPAAPFVIVKDSRIALLSGVWFEAARQNGFDVAVVIPARHPHEVIASLVARDGTATELASALWLKYILLSERYMRAVPRVFVEYANLLDDWRREMARISAALSVDLSARDEGAIDEFLTADLRRHRHCGPVTDPFGADWVSTVYEVVGAAARGQPWDQSTLDRVFEQYRASERGFRLASENCRAHFRGALDRSLAHRVYHRAVAMRAIRRT